MRQIAMTKNYLLLFVATLLSYSLQAQIDQDGGGLNIGIECNNVDLAQFEADLEAALDVFPFTDNNTGECNGVLIYQTGSISFNSSDPYTCLLYTSPSPRDQRGSRMPSSA